MCFCVCGICVCWRFIWCMSMSVCMIACVWVCIWGQKGASNVLFYHFLPYSLDTRSHIKKTNSLKSSYSVFWSYSSSTPNSSQIYYSFTFHPTLYPFTHTMLQSRTICAPKRFLDVWPSSWVSQSLSEKTDLPFSAAKNFQ